jgi:7-keto-8-aminopelargonate synthetase-like enzyme
MLREVAGSRLGLAGRHLRLEQGYAPTMGAQAAWLFGQGLILFAGATACLVTAARIFFIHQRPERGVRAGLWFAVAWLLTLAIVTQLVGIGPR